MAALPATARSRSAPPPRPPNGCAPSCLAPDADRDVSGVALAASGLARRLPSGAASSHFLDPPSWRRDVRPEDSGPIRARATWRMTLGAGSEQGRRPTGEPMRDALTLWIVKAVLSPWPPRRRLYQRICGPVFDPGKPVGGWTTKLRRVNVGTTSDVSFYDFESVAG